MSEVNMKYIILLAVSVVSGACASAQYDKRAEQLKADFRRGFLISCEPTISSQIERAGLADYVSTEQKLAYCVCVGIKIFDDFSNKEVEQFLITSELPPRKKLARSTYSEDCADSEW
jgi:hypothetical protein|tara:strand:+ start:613 stop:963 length:351 start_codon:yes stop_codon:yes gene_type:complete